MCYNKDELTLFNEIIKVALDNDLIEKTDAVISLKNKIEAELKSEIGIEASEEWCKHASKEEINMMYRDKSKKVDSLIEDVYTVIKDNNGHFDLLDIIDKFPYVTCDIPCIAVARLMNAGRVEQLEIIGKVEKSSKWIYYVKE